MIETDVMKNVEVKEYLKSDRTKYRSKIMNVFKMIKHSKEKGIVSLEFATVDGVNFTIYNNEIPTSELERFMKEYVEGKPVIELDGDYVNMATVAVINPTYENMSKEIIGYYTIEGTPREVFYNQDKKEFYCTVGGQHEK